MNPYSPTEAHDQRTAWWQRRSQAISVILFFVIVVFLIQLYLIDIAVEEYLAERHLLALPTFLASGVCFLLNLVFLRYLHDLDREKGN